MATARTQLTPVRDFDDLVLKICRRVQKKLGYRSVENADGIAALYYSEEADRLKEQIVAVGRKLWERRYVDGCGGNISVRLSSDYVLCTPTMLSKVDVTPADVCMTDLDGNLVFGERPRTSELLLHLLIYKENPAARAVVHCHPPHATAYAMTGLHPAVGCLVEQELFVGPVPIAPYETPGTAAFADTIRPFVQNHNSILLANHGIVCWSQNLMHAEWLVEIVDNYCQTLMLAAQLGPLNYIPDHKIAELLTIKRRLNYPDPRLEDLPPSDARANSTNPRPTCLPAPAQRSEMEDVVRAALAALMEDPDTIAELFSGRRSDVV